jgi:3-oxoacyl-(acyl-carrier-protein) synthase
MPSNASCLWKEFIYPTNDLLEINDYSLSCFSPAFEVKGIRSFNSENKILLGDKRQAARSSSRACALMKYACSHIPQDLMDKLKEAQHKTGIYCGVENGTVDYSHVQETESVTKDEFAAKYKLLRNPKMYLKQLPNLAATHLSIFYEITGPTYVFTHSINGGVHALEQAQFDLDQGIVDYALVVSAFSNEDELNLYKNSLRTEKSLSEGAVVTLLERSEESNKNQNTTNSDLKYHYGISTKLIQTLGLMEK